MPHTKLMIKTRRADYEVIGYMQNDLGDYAVALLYCPEDRDSPYVVADCLYNEDGFYFWNFGAYFADSKKARKRFKAALLVY